MITATFHYEGQTCVSYEISGHAYAGEPGHDLVCAGVSAAVFGLTNAIIGISKTEPEIEMTDAGYIHVSQIASDESLQTLVFGLVTSLETIMETNSEHLKLIKNQK